MKKLLLFAAMAAVALGASAGYTIKKLWDYNDISSIAAADARQGLGMNGKFYINDKAASLIYIYDETGQIGTMPGSPNCAISRDEAGNIIMSNVTFPGSWGTNAKITVVNPTTRASKTYVIPAECGTLGRCDVLGIAKGDMMTDGILYMTTNSSANAEHTLIKVVVSNGAISADDSYTPAWECVNDNPIAPVVTSTTTPIYAYTDLEGNEALLYNTRTNPPLKLLPDGDGYSGATFGLPYRGTTMGLQPFIWDGMELFLYNYKGAGYLDYWDGLAVAKAGATEPLVFVPATVSARANDNQINWLWAEPDAEGVTIYQYYPEKSPGLGGHLSVYRMTKTPDYTVASNILGNWTIDPANNMTLGEDGLYTLTVENVEIPANYTIEYKVTSDGTWWPADFNAQYVINEAGYYTLVFTFDLETGNVSLVATKTGDIHYTGDVYIMGEVNSNGWQTNVGLQMTRDEENNIYTATITTEGKNIDPNDGIGYNYFSFTKMLSEYENDWNTIAPYRFGAVTEGGDFLVTNEQLNKELSLEMNGDPHAFKIPAGQWNLTLSVDDMTLIIEKVVPAGKRGDVDNNNIVDINDVTRLIDVVLGKDVEYHFNNSDCNVEGGNGNVDINDVTALINFVLTGAW